MVLKGVLSGAGLPAVLAQLADGGSSGCLHVKDPVGEQAKVYLRGGRVYSATYPGRAPQLGARLVSSGDLAPESLADALEAQRTELQGWRLSELLVHLGYVEQPVVEAFVQEQLRAAAADLLLWDEGTWRFRVNERTREDVATPVEVADLLAEVERRREAWEAIRAQVPGGGSVPVLASAGSTEDELAIDPDAWSLLCKVDGLRTVAELARDGGFTLYEAAGVVSTLVTAGLVEVLPPEPETPAVDGLIDSLAVETQVGDVPPADELPAQVAPAVTSALLAAFAPAADLPTDAARSDADLLEEDLEGSLHRVSSELAAMLGPGRVDEDVFAAVTKAPLPVSEPDPDVLRLAGEREAVRRRDRARRPGDAAELLAAQAELEAARVAAAGPTPSTGPLPSSTDAVIVDLAGRRNAKVAGSVPLPLDDTFPPSDDAPVADHDTGGDPTEAKAVETGPVEPETSGTVLVEPSPAEAGQDETEDVRPTTEADVAPDVAYGVAEQSEQERPHEQDQVEAAQVEAARAEAAAVQARDAQAAVDEAAQAEADAAHEAAVQAAAEQDAAAVLEVARAEAAQVEAAQVEAAQVEAARVEAARVEAAEAERDAAQAEQDRRVEEERLAEQSRKDAEDREAESERLRAEAEREEAVQAEQAQAEQEEAERAQAEQAAAEQAAAEQAEQERMAREAARAQELAAQELAAQELAAQELAAQQAQQKTEEEAEARVLAEAEAREVAAPGLIPAQAMSPDEAADLAARARAELAEAVGTPPAPPDEASPNEAGTGPAHEPEPELDDSPVWVEQDTDTASLLRELSSLGFDDDDPDEGVRPASRHPVGAYQSKQKKKGLFGRG